MVGCSEIPDVLDVKLSAACKLISWLNSYETNLLILHNNYNELIICS